LKAPRLFCDLVERVAQRSVATKIARCFSGVAENETHERGSLVAAPPIGMQAGSFTPDNMRAAMGAA